MKTSIIASGAALLCAVAGAAVGTPVLEARATATRTLPYGVERPSERPINGDPRVQGCFSSGGNLVYVQDLEFNARDTCPKAICMVKLGKNVGGTIRGTECWCGDNYPPKSSLVDDSQCNIGCSGYDVEACGGEKTFTIYNTGKTLYNIDNLPDETVANTTQSAGPLSTPTDPSAPATVTSQGTSAPSSNSSSTPGLIVGAIVGVAALAAIAAGVWFFLRKRRNSALEEEHRRNAAVSAFINGNKPPSSSGASFTDSRMDPQMAQRRMSDGSIADNQDYSRRILRVTNA